MVKLVFQPAVLLEKQLVHVGGITLPNVQLVQVIRDASHYHIALRYIVPVPVETP